MCRIHRHLHHVEDHLQGPVVAGPHRAAAIKLVTQDFSGQGTVAHLQSI